MKKILLSEILCFFIYASCLTYPCNNINLTPVFIGFSKSDVDTMILRAYYPNDSFNHLIDTAFIAEPNLPETDSIYLYMNGVRTDEHSYLALGPDYDWQIYLPAINRTITVSKMVNIRKEGKGHGACINEIQSCDVNGQLVRPVLMGYDNPHPPAFGYMIYIEND